MAKGGNRKQRAPVYSADTLALRIFFGIALAALGVIIFMAVVLRMGGAVFEGVRNVSYGLTGGLAAMLPILPLWAGILMIWSSQSRAPVRPLLWGTLAYAGLCTFIVLVTRVGTQTLLSLLTQMAGRNWGSVIREGYRFCMQKGSGGSLGILIGWPLQQILGDVLPAGIMLILTLLCVLMALNLSPRRIRDLVTGRAQFRRSRQEAERDRASREQVAWQQEQERQEQERQRLIWLQQQAQQVPRMQSPQAGQAYTVPQGYATAGYTAPVTGAGPLPDDRGVSEWQENLGDRQAQQESGGGRSSEIFDVKRGDQPGQEAPKSSFISRIFHRNGESDGLCDASPEEKNRQARQAREHIRRAAQAGQGRTNAPEGESQGRRTA